MTTEPKAPTVFGRRMRRDPNAVEDWFLKVHGCTVFVTKVIGAYEPQIHLPSPFDEAVELGICATPQAAARDIERKLSQLKKQLERMGA